MTVYLDWNATTPPHPDVLEAMRTAADEAWGNPASVHAVGRRARAVVEKLRETLASLVAAHPRDVVFTSSGTEANNLALSNVPGLVTSRIEHPSVVRSAERLAARGVPIEWIDLDASGAVDPGAINRALGRLPQGSTAAVMAVNHETGVVQPIEAVLAVTKARGGRLHVDAVQALGKVELTPLFGVDSIAVAAHKFRGPKGVGALVWRGSPALLSPVLVGGPQERGLRPGTLDAVGAAGFRVALERAVDGPARYRGIGRLRDRIEAELVRFATPNASSSERAPHVSNLFVRGWRGDELVAAMRPGGRSDLEWERVQRRERGAVRGAVGDVRSRASIELHSREPRRDDPCRRRNAGDFGLHSRAFGSKRRELRQSTKWRSLLRGSGPSSTRKSPIKIRKLARA